MCTSFAGFDTSAYPTDAVMRKWKDSSPYVFAAYYIASPCHRVSSWMGKRAAMIDMGWNLLPVYVGQQVVGSSKCPNTTLTAAQGTIDGQDADDKVSSEGFADGTYVYLDIERCDTLPEGMKDYAKAWIAALTAKNLCPGIYCHLHNACDIRAAVGASPRFWIAGGVTSHFHLDTSKPTDSGVAFADLWQCPQPVTKTFAGASVLVDENVSAFADPSAPVVPT